MSLFGDTYSMRHLQHTDGFHSASGSMSLELERENSRMMLSIRGIPQPSGVADLKSRIH